jgi:hypothetical protein
MGKEFKGQTGAKIIINIATFRESAQLKACIAKELLKQNIDIGNANSLAKLKDELNNSVPKLLNTAKDLLLSCEVSEEFNKALFDCLKHCTYDNITITEDLFEVHCRPEAREDYYMIVFECIKENILPFFKGLLSKLKTLNPTNVSSQK